MPETEDQTAKGTTPECANPPTASEEGLMLWPDDEFQVFGEPVRTKVAEKVSMITDPSWGLEGQLVSL